MERTIDKIVKRTLEDAAKAPKIVRNVIPNPGGIEVIWNRADGGAFLAHIVMRSISPQGVAYAAADFANWINNEWLPRQARVEAPPQEKQP